MLKVLIVDDSALMRRQMTQILTDDGIETFTARNGAEALRMVPVIDPDVITLDVNMPEMDGLTMLSLLMVENPKPVIMVSSITERGALATFEAMELGAIDFVHKPGGTVSHNLDVMRDEILAKVRAAATVRLRRRRDVGMRVPAQSVLPLKQALLKPAPAAHAKEAAFSRLVVIGVSTGGPGTLEQVLFALPADFPAPIVIAQHMPANFTNVFAKRLNESCGLTVVEVSQPLVLQPATVYIGRGDADLLLSLRGSSIIAAATPPSSAVLWHPSVDLLVKSAMRVMPAGQLIGVMLTGMGNDGAEAMAAMRQAGARTIAESAETAVVFGMPQELIKRDGAERILPCQRIGGQLDEWVTHAPRRSLAQSGRR